MLTNNSTDPWLDIAINEIYKTYGDRVSILEKGKSLLKFGTNKLVTNATSGSTIMTLPSGIDHETYVNTNSIDTISSSSGSDTEIITIEGHTISGDDLTFVTQIAILNGQNKVTLSTPLARMTRMANNNGTNLVGTVYGYEDTAISGGVPTDGTKVHCMIPVGRNQSLKCSTSISSVDYWIVPSLNFYVLEKSSAFAEGYLQTRPITGVFRERDVFSSGSGNSHTEDYRPYFIIPPNTDVRIIGIGSGASTHLGASIHGVLARKEG